MNIRLKNFILNGLTYGIFFFLLSFVMGYYSVSLPLNKALIVSVPIGLVTFILNGFIQTRFTKSLRKLEAISISTNYAESIILEAPANHYIDDHLISGKLVMTDGRLIFKSFSQDEFSWKLSDFEKFEFYPSLFNVGGEFIIYDMNQNKLVFEVDEIKAWKRKLIRK